MQRDTAAMQTLSAEDVRQLSSAQPGDPLTLTECDLSGESLRRIDFSEWTFRDCVFDDADLTKSDLSRSVWRGGSARQTKFIDADLVDAAFHGVDLSAARLTGTLLTDAVFDGCRAMGAYFDRSRGLGMTFTGCNLFAANLDGCAFGGKPQLRNRFDEASLQKADLHDCVLDDCSLRGADLTGARLFGADLRGATIGDCDADRLAWLRGAMVNPEQAAAILATAADVIVL